MDLHGNEVCIKSLDLVRNDFLSPPSPFPPPLPSPFSPSPHRNNYVNGSDISESYIQTGIFNLSLTTENIVSSTCHHATCVWASLHVPICVDCLSWRTCSCRRNCTRPVRLSYLRLHWDFRSGKTDTQTMLWPTPCTALLMDHTLLMAHTPLYCTAYGPYPVLHFLWPTPCTALLMDHTLLMAHTPLYCTAYGPHPVLDFLWPTPCTALLMDHTLLIAHTLLVAHTLHCTAYGPYPGLHCLWPTPCTALLMAHTLYCTAYGPHPVLHCLWPTPCTALLMAHTLYCTAYGPHPAYGSHPVLHCLWPTLLSAQQAMTFLVTVSGDGAFMGIFTIIIHTLE